MSFTLCCYCHIIISSHHRSDLHLIRFSLKDYASFLAMALFAASNGWCSTLAMIYGPQQANGAVGEKMDLGSRNKKQLNAWLRMAKTAEAIAFSLNEDPCCQVQHPSEQHRAGVIMELGLILGIFAGHLFCVLTPIYFTKVLKTEIG